MGPRQQPVLQLVPFLFANSSLRSALLTSRPMISDVNEPGIHPRGVPSRMGEVVQKVVNRGGSGIVRVLSLDKGELLRIGWFGHITE